jgi:hypothetical protein
VSGGAQSAPPAGAADHRQTPPIRVPIPPGSFDFPDLQFSRFEVLREVERTADGHFSVGVSFSVTNAGRAPSTACKVTAQGAGGQGTVPLMLAADRQTSRHDAEVGPLGPGESRSLTGRVAIQRELAGRRVEIFLTIDDPSTDEFGSGHGTVRELNEGNNSTRRHAVQLPLVIDDPRTVAAAPARVAPRTQPEEWTLGVSRVQVDRQTEDGDEPYFLTYGFRAKLGESGSARAFWQGDVGEIVVDARRGRPITVPAWMARATFPGVKRITWEEYVGGVERLEFIGLIVVALEHDATDFDDVRRLAPRAVEPIRREVERLIGEVRIPIANPDAAIAAASDRIRREIEPTTREIVFKVWEATVRIDKLPEIADPDDFIGVTVLVLVATETDYGLITRDGMMPAPRLRSFGDWTTRFLGTAADRCDWLATLFATTPRKVVP